MASGKPGAVQTVMPSTYTLTVLPQDLDDLLF
jgi:hypothetical protein